MVGDIALITTGSVCECKNAAVTITAIAILYIRRKENYFLSLRYPAGDISVNVGLLNNLTIDRLTHNLLLSIASPHTVYAMNINIL